MQIDILMCKLCYPWCIKHQRDIFALSAVYQIYCTGGAFEVWLKYEISSNIDLYHVNNATRQQCFNCQKTKDAAYFESWHLWHLILNKCAPYWYQAIRNSM